MAFIWVENLGWRGSGVFFKGGSFFDFTSPPLGISSRRIPFISLGATYCCNGKKHCWIGPHFYTCNVMSALVIFTSGGVTVGIMRLKFRSKYSLTGFGEIQIHTAYQIVICSSESRIHVQDQNNLLFWSSNQNHFLYLWSPSLRSTLNCQRMLNT